MELLVKGVLIVGVAVVLGPAVFAFFANATTRRDLLGGATVILLGEVFLYLGANFAALRVSLL